MTTPNHSPANHRTGACCEASPTSTRADQPSEGIGVAPTADSPRTGFTCPMHPEIVRSEPGRCPICRMFLVSLS